MEPLGKKLNSIDAVVKSYIILLTVLLFAGFPMALFIPLGYGYNIFNFFFPAFLFASGSSAALLVMLRKGDRRLNGIEICCALIFLSYLVSTLFNNSPGAEFLKYCGLALIPVGLALAYRVLPEFTTKAFSYGAFSLWLINIVHCYHKFSSINDVGITGNRNWLSALVLATSVIAAKVMKDIASKWLKNEKVAWALAVILAVLLTVPIIIKTDSRASYTALIALPVYIAFVLNGRKVRLGIAVALIAGCIAAPFVFKEAIDRESKRNIRFPMWSSTMEMLVENPLGFGPESFESKYPEYVSQEHKEMLVSAVTSAHPHNEFLHVSVSGGVVAGISWLLIVYFALFYKYRNKDELLFMVPLFILFVQGMMDKPLYQMPTMLLFYVLLGLILGKKELLSVSLKKPDKEKLTLYKAVAALLLLAFSYFTVVTTSSSWYERKAMMAEQEGDKEKALALFTKSVNLASWRTFPAYKAFIISVVDKPDPARAIDFYEILEARAPDLRQFNLLKGKFFTQLAMQDRAKAQEHLENAWKSYNRACELNVTNILSFIDRVKFAARFLPAEQLNESYRALVELYNFKIESAAQERKIDLAEWGEKWKTNKKYSEFLQSSVSLVNLLKVPLVASEYYPRKFTQLIPTFTGTYNIADMVYATDAFLLMNELPKGAFPLIIKSLLSDIKIDNNKQFTMPRKVLREKSGNSLSRLCLLAMTARSFAYDSLIDKASNAILLLKENKFFRIDKDGFKELSHQQAVEYVKGREFHYFDYPQAFFYKNEILSYSLAKAGASPQYCRNPDFVINNFVKRFSRGAFSIKILEEPFEDILNKMQGRPQ